MAHRMSGLRDRLERAEKILAPKARHFVFVYEEPDARSYAERLADFRAENGVGQNDVVHEVHVTFQ